jgi:hypothetical protein
MSTAPWRARCSNRPRECTRGMPTAAPRAVKPSTQTAMGGTTPRRKVRRSTCRAPQTRVVLIRSPGTMRHPPMVSGPADRSRSVARSRWERAPSRPARDWRPRLPRARAHVYATMAPPREARQARGMKSHGSRAPVEISTPAPTSRTSPGAIGTGRPASSTKSRLQSTMIADQPWTACSSVTPPAYGAQAAVSPPSGHTPVTVSGGARPRGSGRVRCGCRRRGGGGRRPAARRRRWCAREAGCCRRSSGPARSRSCGTRPG